MKFLTSVLKCIKKTINVFQYLKWVVDNCAILNKYTAIVKTQI